MTLSDNDNNATIHGGGSYTSSNGGYMIIHINVDGKVVFDVPNETITVDADPYELLSELGDTEDVLDMLDYDTVREYVDRVEKERREYENEMLEAERR